MANLLLMPTSCQLLGYQLIRLLEMVITIANHSETARGRPTWRLRRRNFARNNEITPCPKKSLHSFLN